MQTKSAAEASKKWKERVAGATDDYLRGVENPKEDWAARTEASEENYNNAIQESISRGAFGKGVRDSGSSNWKAKTLAKGRTRWSQGVSVGESDFQKGISPYLEVINSLSLPPKRMKGDPGNIERVRIIAEALHRKKVGG